MCVQNKSAMASKHRDEAEKYLMQRLRPGPASPTKVASPEQAVQSQMEERMAGQDVFTRLYAEFCDRLENEFEEKEAREQQAKQAQQNRLKQHTLQRGAANAAAAEVHGRRPGESILHQGVRKPADVSSALFQDAEDRRKRRELMAQQQYVSSAVFFVVVICGVWVCFDLSCVCESVVSVVVVNCCFATVFSLPFHSCFVSLVRGPVAICLV
jgi:hypothetical protein